LKRNTQTNHQPEEQKKASWLTTFNDLVTLLMVFFVLLFSLSTIDMDKMADFQYALQSGLGILEEGNQVSVDVKADNAIDDMSNLNQQAEGGTSPPPQQTMQADIEAALGSLDASIGVQVVYMQQGARLSFEDGVLFDFGRAAISPAGRTVLENLADVIQKMPYPIRVEGHTDNVPIRTRRFPSNWELSTARAVNDVKYFADTGQIDPQRLSAVGYGESKPLVANDSAQHRAKNRRVEIVLIKEGQK
jgi:chemotaxis protein MotB